MEVKSAVVAGLLGSAALVGFELLFPKINRMELVLVRVVAEQVTSSARGQGVLAFVLQFVVGAVFGVVYAGLWSLGIGRPTWAWGVLFGLLHGVLIIALAPLFRPLDPKAFRLLPNRWVWMAGEVADHVLYVVVVALVYGALHGASS